MKIKTVVVGCGQIARLTHIPTILKGNEFDLMGIVETDREVAKYILRLFGIEVPHYLSIDDISLSDAAIVSVPPHLHAEVCIRLLNKGIHVLCEKPMATSYNDCLKMIDASKKTKKTLLIGMTKHYCRNTGLMRDIIEAGYLGEITSYELLSGTRSQWNAANPKRYDPEYVPGGVTFENGVHWIYRLLLWFGSAEVKEYQDDRIDGVEANAVLSCVHRQKSHTVSGKMIFSADHVLPNRLIVYGTDRNAMLMEKDEDGIYIGEKINGRNVWLRMQRDIDEDPIDLFGQQMRDFHKSIQSGCEPEVSLELSAKTIALLMDAYEARTELDQPWLSFKNC